MNIAIIPATMSTRDIAGLADTTHDSVLKTVRALIERGIVSGNETPYTHPQNGQTYTEFRLAYRDTMVVVSGYSVALRARIIDRWQELESAQPAPVHAIPQTYAAALRLCADQSEQIEVQAAQLAIAAPAVAFVDRFVKSEGLKGFREVAKAIKANESQFREFLIDKKIMYRLAGKLTGYQPHIDAGRFEVRAGLARHNEHAFTETKFTPKGLTWVAGEWAKHCLVADAAEA